MFASLYQKKTCTSAESIAAVLPHNEPFFVGFFRALKGIPCRSVDDIFTDNFDWEKKRGRNEAPPVINIY